MRRTKSQFIERLYDAHSLPLVKYLTARFRNSEEAAEVAQEAWLRIQRLDHPEQLKNAKAFLFQTASNLAIDRLRRGQLERRHNEFESALPAEPAPSAERAVSAEESLQIVNEILGQLPDRCRNAFVMHRTRGLSYPEIADQLGVSTSMVEKYIIQSLKHFRNKLDV